MKVQANFFEQSNDGNQTRLFKGFELIREYDLDIIIFSDRRGTRRYSLPLEVIELAHTQFCEFFNVDIDFYAFGYTLEFMPHSKEALQEAIKAQKWDRSSYEYALNAMLPNRCFSDSSIYKKAELIDMFYEAVETKWSSIRNFTTFKNL